MEKENFEKAQNLYEEIGKCNSMIRLLSEDTFASFRSKKTHSTILDERDMTELISSEEISQLVKNRISDFKKLIIDDLKNIIEKDKKEIKKL